MYFSVFIGLADGEPLAEPEVQKSALNVLINCVCGPIERVSIRYWKLIKKCGKRNIVDF